MDSIKRGIVHLSGYLTIALAPVLVHFSGAYSQDKDDNKPMFRRSVKIGAGIPVVVATESFRSLMKGIYTVHGVFDMTIVKNLILGAEGGNSMFDNANFRLKPDVTKGYFTTAGIRTGYEKFLSETSLLTAVLEGGYSWLNYRLSKNINDSVFYLMDEQALQFSCTISYNVIIEETGGVGGFIRYNVIDSTFDPKALKLTGDKTEGLYQFVSLGIVFMLGF